MTAKVQVSWFFPEIDDSHDNLYPFMSQLRLCMDGKVMHG